MTRLDPVLDWFMRPRVRRVARWSFLVTLPLCALLISLRGVDAVLVIFALEFAAFMVVLVVAARLGGERGQVILDLVMHPAIRRLMRSEAVIVLTLPRALLRLARRRRSDDEYAYAKRDVELPLAVALIPAFATELVLVHLLVPDSLGWLRLALLVLSLYGVLWILGWALGLHVFPHRLRDDVLELRLGSLYRATIPLDSIVTLRRERSKSGTRTRLDAHDGAAALWVGGRVDLHVTIDRPVLVERPLGEPLEVTSISFAADDAPRLATRLRGRGTRHTTSQTSTSGGTECMTLLRM